MINLKKNNLYMKNIHVYRTKDNFNICWLEEPVNEEENLESVIKPEARFTMRCWMSYVIDRMHKLIESAEQIECDHYAIHCKMKGEVVTLESLAEHEEEGDIRSLAITHHPSRIFLNKEKDDSYAKAIVESFRKEFEQLIENLLKDE